MYYISFNRRIQVKNINHFPYYLLVYTNNREAAGDEEDFRKRFSGFSLVFCTFTVCI